jgi:hypothetical protein
MQVLIHPSLRLLVVEAVEIIDVDRQVGIGRMRAGGRRKKGMILLTAPFTPNCSGWIGRT